MPFGIRAKLRQRCQALLEPDEVIEVWSDEPVKLTYDLAAFTGRFELIDNGEQGLFFQLKNAAPAP